MICLQPPQNQNLNIWTTIFSTITVPLLVSRKRQQNVDLQLIRIFKRPFCDIGFIFPSICYKIKKLTFLYILPLNDSG